MRTLKYKLSIALAAVLLAPAAFAAAEPTFTFEAQVTRSADSTIGRGSILEGVVSLDYAAGAPIGGSGAPGSSNFTYVSDTGVDYGAPLASQSIVNITETVEGQTFSFQGPAANATDITETLSGSNGQLSGSIENYITAGNLTLGSEFHLLPGTSLSAYDSAGLPNGTAGDSSYGYLNTANGQVSFTILSSTAATTASVPEPATLSLLMLGGAALTRIRKRRIV